MRAPCAVTAAIALLAIGCARQASAQRPVRTAGVSEEQDRVRISVNGGAQLSSIAFDSSATRLVYLENAAIDASYKIHRGPEAEAGVSVRVADDFGVAVVASGFRATHDADVSAALPHPFFFRTPRTITGRANGLERDELAAHLQGFYIIRPARRVEVVVSAGPSFFRVRQPVVTGVAFTDTYPYDAPSFTSASSTRVSGNKVGYNVGVDVGRRFSHHAGIGGGVRFSRAVVRLTMPDGGTTVSSDAGGAQLAGGLRFYF
jgi:hypothetical protein